MNIYGVSETGYPLTYDNGYYCIPYKSMTIKL
jgi:hypothetical protein